MKSVILYCDDQKRFLDKFAEDHKDAYTVIPLSDMREILNILKAMRTLPTLLLLDLYYPRSRGPEQEAKAAIAEKKLAELDKKIEETNEAVLDAWEPRAIRILEDIRQKYSGADLPVVIYTQKGLFLLSDKDIRKAVSLGADWLIKKRFSPQTEELFLDRIIRRSRARSKHVQRDIIISAVFTIVGFLLSKFLG